MSNSYRGDSLCPNFSQIHENLKALKQIDFELAYLALLTCEGLKPLSRWEKNLGENGLRLLHGMNLLTKQIRRTVEAGNEIKETIFSLTPAYLHVYEKSFGHTAIDKSIRTKRIEGFLFGYPPCCVEQYIQKPYAANNLTEQDQEILFHWACKDCKVTPILLKTYKKIHDLVYLSD